LRLGVFFLYSGNVQLLMANKNPGHPYDWYF